MKNVKIYKNAEAEKAILKSYTELLTMWDTKINELHTCDRSGRCE